MYGPSIYAPAAPTGSPKVIAARSFGPCSHCEQGVRPGEMIAAGLPNAQGKRWGHVDCAAALAARPAAPVKAAPETITGLDISPLNGRYAVPTPGSTNEVTFLQVDSLTEGKWAGWSFARQQQGENEIRIGTQRPGQTYSGKLGYALSAALADPKAALLRYGLELGRCGHCNRDLTNDESRALGIGPICREKLGW